ncbi:MAG: AMP-binding protein [Candidatus Dormibacteraeota bacterium]|nr:AMP-binding protein [Candidatus Dormibacteraeota bacterium]
MTPALESVRRELRSGNLPDALLVREGGPIAGLSREELRRRAGEVAGGLAAMGVGAGDRVGLYAANSIEWLLAYLGGQLLGAVLVPFNPAYRSAEVTHIVNDADPRLVITDAARAEFVGGLGRPIVPLEDLPRAEPPPVPTLEPESPALIIYTSGTTGRPKGALLDHGNLLAQARGAIEAWRWSSADLLVHALPLFHLHGLGMGLHGTLLSGGALDLISFDPAAVVSRLRAGATMFFGVPAMYQRLCEHLEREPADLSQVRLFVSGSAPLPPELFRHCEGLLGQAPLERYGITEGGIVVSNPFEGPRRPGRVGFPFAGVEVRLGEADEIQLKGGQVFSGYWRNPGATAGAFIDGWFRTGDVGELDADGSLAIRGRIKELIISGGFNVYPREVELVLEEHPGVAEVAVAGLPSERWGEEVTAFVVARGERPAEEDLIAFAQERLAKFKCPRSIRFIEALPRNAMGKVQRSLLS